MTLKGRLTASGKVHALHRSDRTPQCGVSRASAELVDAPVNCANCLRLIEDKPFAIGDYALTPEGVQVRIVRILPGAAIEVAYPDRRRTNATFNADRLTLTY